MAKRKSYIYRVTDMFTEAHPDRWYTTKADAVAEFKKRGHDTANLIRYPAPLEGHELTLDVLCHAANGNLVNWIYMSSHGEGGETIMGPGKAMEKAIKADRGKK